MSKWIPSWRYVPINYNHDMGVFQDITQRAVITNNLNGSQLRLRFNNLYHTEPMVIDHAAVALYNRETGNVTGFHPVTLGGSERIVVPADTRQYSDVL